MCIYSCNNSYNSSDAIKSSEGISVGTEFKNEIQYKSYIIQNNDGTLGYGITKDSVPYIIQKNIPGKSGNNGFSDSASAYKVADYVIHKLKHNIIPPTISKQELDSLLNFKLNHE